MKDCNIERILNEVTEFIKHNLFLLIDSDETYKGIKEYCSEHPKMDYIPYLELVRFTDEAISEIIDVPYWFDYRRGQN